MARVFFYRYFGEAEANLHDGPERHADDSIPVPSKGDTVVRRGRSWKVLSVACGKTLVPKPSQQPPLEVHVTLVPAEQ